jgi:alpha-mannosidase
VPSHYQGLIIANRGLPELDLVWNKNLYVTLLRAVSTLGDWGVFGINSAQEKGFHELEYSLIPFFEGQYDTENTLSYTEATQVVNEFNTPLIATQILDHETRGPLPETLLDLGSSFVNQLFRSQPLYFKGGGTVEDNFDINPKLPRSNLFPANYSFIELYPTENLILSALKKAEDRETVIMRTYNPSISKVEGKVLFRNKKIIKAFYTNLNEERLEEIQIDNNTPHLSFLVPPKKIVTLELLFN